MACRATGGHDAPVVLAAFHRVLDDLAVWAEDRRRRRPEPVLLAEPEPLACFGPLPALPPPPPELESVAADGTVAAPARTPGVVWTAPSPRPLRSGDRMSIRITAARGARRSIALLVPPWKIAHARLVAGYTRLLARAGQEVWLVSPPHHLDRTLPGARSGEGFVSLDLRRLRAVFEQLVLELRVLVSLASRRGPVGLLGLSLGGLAGALAATAPERLDYAALVAPANVSLTMAATKIGLRYRRLAELAGETPFDEAAMEEALTPFDPSRRAPTARRIFLGSGSHDRIAPPDGQAALARTWGVPLHTYERGHMSLLFLCRALRRDLTRFVGAR
jgi:predicted alpha/beta hydrolase family esterase